MDKLVEFLTSKIGYTLTAIGGLLLPGMLFIFVWDRQVYSELGIIRLLILAVCISFSVFIPNFCAECLVFVLLEKITLNKPELKDVIITPLAYTNIEIYGLLLHKLYNNSFTVLEFVRVVICWGVIIGVARIILQYLKWLVRNKQNKHKK